MAGRSHSPAGSRPGRAAVAGALLALLGTGCAGGWGRTSGPAPEGSGIENVGGATVITAKELHASNQTVLRTLMGKVPNLKVDFVGQARCPTITLRRAKDLYGQSFPLVYLDGTRAQSTCILDEVQAMDLDRVEIYPQGFTLRPGYATSSDGLILLFSRQ